MLTPGASPSHLMIWQQRLLKWYRKNKRDLPWRRTRDPYAIWVSEIMLQQTTVEAVVPYYERFLKTFPEVASLALASEDDVLRLWSGLGYYSRARNLHKAAKMIMARHAKMLPDSVGELQTLPGIGRYTAGAIASIAFERRSPIVDGNVVRVLSRLFAIPKDPKSAEGRKVFWKKAEEILPKKSLGDFNQALMELGAVVCSPEKPACLLCPVRESCAAKKAGRPEDFPAGMKNKTTYRSVKMAAAIVVERGKILMRQRPDRGLLKGMWEFPMTEGGAGDLLRTWPLSMIKTLATVRHSVLNKRLRITPILCRLKGKMSGETGIRWIRSRDLGRLPTSSMNHKILKQLDMGDPAIIEPYGTSLKKSRLPRLPG